MLRALWRRPDGNSSKRECAGCEVSRPRVIFLALLLTLDKYSSWRVGRVVPMNRSAVRTTLRSLLRSDLVAELNQTHAANLSKYFDELLIFFNNKISDFQPLN